MQNSQDDMSGRHSADFWRHKQLVKKAATQASNIQWSQNVNQPLLEGVIQSGRVSQECHWHYADALANTDSEVSFVSEPGVTLGVVFAGRLQIDVAGAPQCIDACQQPIAFCFSHPKPVPLKRLFNAGDIVHKFTLTLSSTWLVRAGVDSHPITTNTCLSQFQATAQLCEQTRLIIEAEDEISLTSRLQNMRTVLQIIEIFCSQYSAAQSLGDKSLADNSAVISMDQKLLDNVDLLINDPRVMLDDLRVSEVANRLSMSESKIQRLAKKCFGMPLLQYIRQQRLTAAYNALVHRELSVGECAFIAGYKYPSNFALAFKKAFSITPGEFKRD